MGYSLCSQSKIFFCFTYTVEVVVSYIHGWKRQSLRKGGDNERLLLRHFDSGVPWRKHYASHSTCRPSFDRALPKRQHPVDSHVALHHGPVYASHEFRDTNVFNVPPPQYTVEFHGRLKPESTPSTSCPLFAHGRRLLCIDSLYCRRCKYLLIINEIL